MKKRTPKPRTRKRKTPKPKTTQPVINITIQVVAKRKKDNSKATLLMYDKYVLARQGIKSASHE